MKTNKSKKILASILAAALVLSAAPANKLMAADKKVKAVVNASASEGISVTYVGEGNSYVYLKVSLNQPKEQKSYLQISDADGENLYEETVTAKEFSRIIKVFPNELSTIHVTSLNGTNEIKRTFAINSSLTAKYELAEVAE